MGPIFAVTLQTALSVFLWSTPASPAESILIADTSATSMVVQPIELVEPSQSELLVVSSTALAEETPVITTAAAGSDLALGALLEASLFYVGGSYTGAFNAPEPQVQAVPEPGSWLVLTCGLGFLARRRQRRV